MAATLMLPLSIGRRCPHPRQISIATEIGHIRQLSGRGSRPAVSREPGRGDRNWPAFPHRGHRGLLQPVPGDLGHDSRAARQVAARRRGSARPRRASSHGCWWLQARFRLVSTTHQWSRRLALMRKHPRAQRQLPTGSGNGWSMPSVLSARACADWLPTSSAIASACCAISIAALVLAAEQWIAFRVPRRLCPQFLGY